MKFIIILLISALAFEDIAERLEHDAKFNKDVERLKELVDRVDTILAFLKGPEAAYDSFFIFSFKWTRLTLNWYYA